MHKMDSMEEVLTEIRMTRDGLANDHDPGDAPSLVFAEPGGYE